MWYAITQRLLARFLSPCWPCLLGRRTRTYFGWSCSQVRGSGRMCFGLVKVDWSSLMQMPGRPSNCVWYRRRWISRGRRAGSNPLWRGWVYRLMYEAPLFRGMPTRLKAFLKPPGICGFWICPWIHLKIALCHTCLVSGMYTKLYTF